MGIDFLEIKPLNYNRNFSVLSFCILKGGGKFGNEFIFSWRQPLQILFPRKGLSKKILEKAFPNIFSLEEAHLNFFFLEKGLQKFFFRFPLPPRSLTLSVLCACSKLWTVHFREFLWIFNMEHWKNFINPLPVRQPVLKKMLSTERVNGCPLSKQKKGG